MTLVWATLIVVGVAVAAIASMLFVRRSAPEGSYFEDGDRAAGVFGVLATAFAVLIGFVVFLAFESFDTSRSGAEDEARIVRQEFETAQFLPREVRSQVAGQVVCYARAVVHQEWPALESGTLGNALNPWGAAMFRTIHTVEPRLASEQTAYDKWFDERSDREDARADRVHGSEGVIPFEVWIVLFLSAVIIFVFMLFFADSAERAIVQATMIGGVALVISSSLLLLWFLDHPYHRGVGGLRPTEMERTLAIMGQEEARFGTRVTPPCDARGVALG